MASTGETGNMGDLNLGFIGCGKMAQAIIKGVIKSGLTPPGNIIGSAVQEKTINTIKSLGIRASQDNGDVARGCDVIVVAVKPHLVTRVLQEVRHDLRHDALVVSVAAGVTISTIEEALPKGVAVVRVMPSLPASIGWGISAVSLGACALPKHGELVSRLFKTCGFVEQVPENYIDIMTAVCTPIISFVAIEAMSDGAVKMGLPRDLATRLAAQSLMGGAQLVAQSSQHPAAMKDAVCSPGGTTIAGLHRLEAGGFRSAAMDAVEAATLRARELGARK